MAVTPAEWTDWEQATKGQVFISEWMWSLFQWGFPQFGDWEGCFMFPFPSLICFLICGGLLCPFCVCIAGSQDWPLSVWTLFCTLSLSKVILSPEGFFANETTVTAALKKEKKVPEISVCIPGIGEPSCCTAPDLTDAVWSQGCSWLEKIHLST